MRSSSLAYSSAVNPLTLAAPLGICFSLNTSFHLSLKSCDLVYTRLYTFGQNDCDSELLGQCLTKCFEVTGEVERCRGGAEERWRGGAEDRWRAASLPLLMDKLSQLQPSRHRLYLGSGEYRPQNHRPPNKASKYCVIKPNTETDLFPDWGSGPYWESSDTGTGVHGNRELLTGHSPANKRVRRQGQYSYRIKSHGRANKELPPPSVRTAAGKQVQRFL